MSFYVLEPEEGIRFGRKWAYADIVNPSNSGGSEKCPVCGSHVSGLKWLPPHRIKLSSAKPEKWGDFVWGAGFPLIVSDRFKEVYERERLSGIAEFSAPIEIVRMGTLKSGYFPVAPPNYHLVHIPWGGANLDDTASNLTYEYDGKKPLCSYCRSGISNMKQDGFIIEASSWNGSDLFVARGATGVKIVSEKFKQVVEEYDLKNVWLIPVEKYGYDEKKKGLYFVHD